MITIEDTVIEWRSGHLVLNVHSCRDLPGGSMEGSSDDERKGRRRSKRINLQELLRSEPSVDEDLDDTISVGISDSDCYQDSDSSWNLEKEKKRDQKRRDARKNKGGDRTVRQVSAQNIQNARRNKGGDQTVQEVSVQNNQNARILVGILDSDCNQDSDSSWNLEKEKNRDRKRRNARRNQVDDRTVQEVSAKNTQNARRNQGDDRTVQEVSARMLGGIKVMTGLYGR